MKSEVEEIFYALQESEVRYLVAGGLAVMAHGYIRYTADVDLIIDLEPENLLKGLRALKTLGYQPRLPVKIEEFSDPDIRKSWIEEKGMMVFSMWRPGKDRGFTVDIFNKEPFEFAAELENAKVSYLDDGTRVPFISLACLLEMKRKAGRDKDLTDIHALEKLQDG